MSTQSTSVQSQIGIVVIGRNEGERLRRCLTSVDVSKYAVVYVDSGSTDGSLATSREYGADVVELDLSTPFTAARARNAGLRMLVQAHPEIKRVQFVDGDCELEADWLEIAATFLEGQSNAAIVCGDLSERHPKRSIYNRLCALEWKGNAGDVRSCGGIFMIRRDAFEQVGGFNESLIAGEEPELCKRLRDAGWRVHRFNVPMATHDAAMTRFSQWWRRAVRTGHAYAEAAYLHRRSDEKPWRREVVRNWFWGLLLPLLAIVLAWPSFGVSLLLLLLYPLWMWRIARDRRQRIGDAAGDAWLYAFFCMLAKIPAALGQLLFWWRRLLGRQMTLIEYKTSEPTPAHKTGR